MTDFQCKSIKSAKEPDIRCTAKCQDGSDFCGRHGRSKNPVYFSIKKIEPEPEMEEPPLICEPEPEMGEPPLICEPEPETDETISLKKNTKKNTKKAKPGPKKGEGISILNSNKIDIYNYEILDETIIIFTDDQNQFGILINIHENLKRCITVIDDKKLMIDEMYPGGLFEKIIYNPLEKSIKKTGSCISKHNVKTIKKISTIDIPIIKAKKKELTEKLTELGKKPKPSVKVAELREILRTLPEPVEYIQRESDDISMNEYDLIFKNDLHQNEILTHLKEYNSNYIDSLNDERIDTIPKLKDMIEISIDSVYLRDQNIYCHLTHEILSKQYHNIYSQETDEKDKHILLGSMVKVNKSCISKLYHTTPAFSLDHINSSFIITKKIVYVTDNPDLKLNIKTEYEICIATGFSIKSTDLDIYIDNQITERIYLIKKSKKTNRYIKITNSGIKITSYEEGDFSFIIGFIKSSKIHEIHTNQVYEEDKERKGFMTFKIETE